ncbi:hypothetical protein NQ176_g159 [Zarea fungicola]|uniref:Uncharacterized protein n=1 Tax=Zarea fungicola TaxID=93591 RepID=A0ACC1NXT0_9HYPO|nr:hypothetical protein NQ176_g159 [Lecanicillium fungicola]
MAEPYGQASGSTGAGDDNASGDEEIQTMILASRENTREKERLSQQKRLIQSLRNKLKISDQKLEAAEQRCLELGKIIKREQGTIKDESDHRNVQEELNYRQQKLDKDEQELDDRRQELDQRQQDMARQEQELEQRQKTIHEKNNFSRRLYFGLYLSILSAFDAVEKYKKRRLTKMLFEGMTHECDEEKPELTGLESLQSELARGEDGYSSNSDIEGVEETKYAAKATIHGQSQSLFDELAILQTEWSGDRDEDMSNYAEATTHPEDIPRPPGQRCELNTTAGTIYRNDSQLSTGRTRQVKAAPHAADGCSPERAEENYAGNKPVYEIATGVGSVIFGRCDWALMISWIQSWRTTSVCNWSAVGAFHHFTAVSAVLQLIFWVLCINLIRAAQISSNKSEEELELWSFANGLTREYLLHHAYLGNIG